MVSKRFNLGISLLVAILVICIASMGGCAKQSSTRESSLPIPTPPTEPVTPGYVRNYWPKFGYGFEYPEDWAEHSPEEFTMSPGFEKVEMFTKKGEGTSITIIVKSTDWTNLEEVKKQYGEMHPRKIVLKEGIIEVNSREGYEIIYKSPPTKTRVVVFLANGRAFIISYSTNEDLYDASEEIFDHVLNSFIIK